MKLKKKVKKPISKKQKSARKSFFTKKTAPVSVTTAGVTEVDSFWSERAALFAALFFFAFGMGLISDGKKVYQQQLKVSQRVDYKATQPYSAN